MTFRTGLKNIFVRMIRRTQIIINTTIRLPSTESMIIYNKYPRKLKKINESKKQEDLSAFI